MAEGLLWLPLMGCALSASIIVSGCLVPQDETPLKPDPIFFNLAPRLLNVNPAFPYIEINDESDCELQFSVNAADPDINQTIRLRYYVDYDPATKPGFEREFVFSNLGQEERPETAVFVTDVGAALNPLGQTGVHLVEAMVFDGTLSPTRAPEPLGIIPDGGVNPSYVDVHQWVVNTVFDCRTVTP